MNKKSIFLLLVLAVIITGGLFAQENSSGIKNWISGEVGVLGIGVRYERMLNSHWSIGGNGYWNNLFLFLNDLGIDVTARYYPWGKSFFVGMGLGYHLRGSLYEYDDTDSRGYTHTYSWFGTINGAAITPEVGWKIDVGSEGGFFLQPGIKLPITLGALEILGGTNKTEFRAGFSVVAYLGMGYAF